MESKVVARKNHKCDNCGKQILKGELYNYEAFYIKANYDAEFDRMGGGYMYQWRSHIDDLDCAIADHALTSTPN